MHLVNGMGNSPSPGRPTPGVVKQDKSSGGSVDTTKTRSGPQRVRMSSGERPIGTAKGKQSDAEALCQAPPGALCCGGLLCRDKSILMRRAQWSMSPALPAAHPQAPPPTLESKVKPCKVCPCLPRALRACLDATGRGPTSPACPSAEGRVAREVFGRGTACTGTGCQGWI